MIINELADRGHNVTVISPFTNESASPRNAHYIPFGDGFQSILSDFVKIQMSSNEKINPFLEQFLFASGYATVCSGESFHLFFSDLYFSIQLYMAQFYYITHRIPRYKWSSNVIELPKRF